MSKSKSVVNMKATEEFRAEKAKEQNQNPSQLEKAVKVLMDYSTEFETLWDGLHGAIAYKYFEECDLKKFRKDMLAFCDEVVPEYKPLILKDVEKLVEKKPDLKEEKYMFAKSFMKFNNVLCDRFYAIGDTIAKEKYPEEYRTITKPTKCFTRTMIRVDLVKYGIDIIGIKVATMKLAIASGFYGMANKILTLPKRFIGGIKNMFVKVKTIVKKAVQKAKDTVKKVIDKVKETVKKIGAKIKGIFVRKNKKAEAC